MDYTHVEQFTNEHGEVFEARYDEANSCGWLAGSELDDDWLCIYEGVLEQPLTLGEDESLWLENWWYRATKTRLVTLQSMMSSQAEGFSAEAIAQRLAAQLLAAQPPQQVIAARPVGGRPRIEHLSEEERPVMLAYDVGTKPMEIARERGEHIKYIRRIIANVRRRRKRHAEE